MRPGHRPGPPVRANHAIRRRAQARQRGTPRPARGHERLDRGDKKAAMAAGCGERRDLASVSPPPERVGRDTESEAGLPQSKPAILVYRPVLNLIVSPQNSSKLPLTRVPALQGRPPIQCRVWLTSRRTRIRTPYPLRDMANHDGQIGPALCFSIGVRIVSLLPSATEALFAFGVGDQVVAVTHECDFPPEARKLPVVTRSTLGLDGRDSADIEVAVSGAAAGGQSLYAVDSDAIRALVPDLIVAQDVCRVCAVDADQVAQDLDGIRMIRQHPHSLEDVLVDIESLAAACKADAAPLMKNLRGRIDAA